MSRDTALDLIDLDPDQPRRHVDAERLGELADSMRENGLAQPVLLRPVGDRFVIVAGERRVRAARELDWLTIPAVVRDIDLADVPWTQLAENLQRADLSPVEEAAAYQRLIDSGHSHAAVADRVGKTRSYVSQKLRLLDLPASLVTYLDRGALSEGHARQLLRLRGALDGVTVGDVVSHDTDWSVFTEPVDADHLGEAIVAFRPLDWPRAYPVLPDADHPRLPIMAAATARGFAELDPDARWWTIAAWWWATITVAVELTVAQLDQQLDFWFDLVASALLTIKLGAANFNHFYFDTDGYPTPGAPAQLVTEWWGHRSDLRHAGLTCLLDDDDRRRRWLRGPGERALARAAGDLLLAPSICQPGAPHADEWIEARE